MTDLPDTTISDDAQDALVKSIHTAVRLGGSIVSIDHLLAAILEARPIVDLLALCSPNADLVALTSELQATFEEQAQVKPPVMPAPTRMDRLQSFLRTYVPPVAKKLEIFRFRPTFDEAASGVLEKACSRAHQTRHVNCQDVLLAFFDGEQRSAADALQRHGITRYDLTSYLAHGAAKINAYASADFGGDNVKVSLYLLNDNYTTVEFVIEILTSVLSFPLEQATSIERSIHGDGRAGCGVFPFAVALDKLNQIHKLAREKGHPLRGCLERA